MQTRAMNDTITRIRPDLPLCWEDPDTLRVGFERAQARVRHPSPGAQRLIGALVSGIAPRRLSREAQRLGATPQEARELLTALSPALESVPAPGAPDREAPIRTAPDGDGSTGRAPLHGASRGDARRRTAAPAAAQRSLRALVCDDGREVPGLRAALSATGLCALDEQPSLEQGYELVVHVERFLEPLERAQRWLSLAVPHLLIRFTDRTVTVGPLVSELGAPCHTCCALTMLDEDPAYPVLAAQLYGSSPRTETAAGAHMAAAFAAMLIGRWRAGDPSARATRAIIPMRRGQVSDAPRLVSVAPHPECACGAFTPADPPPR